MISKSLARRDRYGVPLVERLKSDISSVFDGVCDDSFWNITEYSLLPITKGREFPKVNVSETDDSYEVEIAVAGFDKDDISLILKDNQLNISAEKNDVKEGKNFLQKEIAYRSFNRSIGFPKKIEDNSCSADYKNGVIYVSLKKVNEEEKPDGVMIEIK